MKPTTPRLKLAGVALVAVILSVIGGCLKGREAFVGRYDAAKDRFVFANFLEGVYGDGAGDYDGLKALWAQRANIVTMPLPAGEGIRFGLLRLSNHQFAWINPRNPGDSAEQAKLTEKGTETTLSLDEIEVTPGEFFMRGDRACYYDGFAVSGKFVDGVLEEVRKAYVPELLKVLDAERQRRAGGGKVMAWKDFLSYAAPEATHDAPKLDTQPELTWVLTDRSLQLITAAVSDGSVKVQRQGPIFNLSVPLDPADAKEALAAADVARTRMLAEADAKQRDDVKAALDAVIITASPEGKLTISVDAARVIPLLSHATLPLDPLTDPDKAEDVPKQHDAKTDITARGIPINGTLTIEQIIEKTGATPVPAAAK